MINAEALREAFDLAQSIVDDIADEIGYPSVVDGASLNSALDNAQQLLESLQAIKEASHAKAAA